jgi:uncharacterized protein DUF3592
VGAFFLMIGVMELIGGLASRRWDAVSGEIIESRFTLARWQRVHWEVEIRYRYTVEGRTYEGDRFCFGTGMAFSSRRAAEHAVTMYPKGRIVTLFVSPSDRSRAVIEPGVGWRAAMPFLSGGLLVALGIASILG